MIGTERRKSEPREQDERYQQLVELAPDGILVHDGGRIVLANAAAVRLAGAASREQLLGLPIDTLLDPPFLKAVQSQLVGSREPADPAPAVRDTLRRLDGSEMDVEVRVMAFLDRGRPSAHIVIRDISERVAVERTARQVEKHLQQAQRMEAVGALAGGVAHEVNNMMTVVLGFSGFLLRDPDLPEERREEARHIVRAAERAALVTQQLLAFSRRAFHRPEVLDLGAVIGGLEPMVRRLLGEDRRLILESEGSPRVLFDAGQLEQVIVNLALNARDAMLPGGTLTITTEEAALPDGAVTAGGAAIPAGRYGLLVVRDTGAGIDAVTQRRIFEPFFTTKPVGHGTGLGLSAAYGIMKQNDAFIGVESAPGEGAVFSLYLPLVPADAAEPRATRAWGGRNMQHGEAMVLLVEDEADVRAVAARTLGLGGFRVLEAADGAAAIELVERHGRPDLVLTDLIMPGIGGFELARHLRERWPELPILFMSGYSAADLRRQGVVGLDGPLVKKPFSPDGLVSSVAAALAQESPTGEE